MIRYWFDIPIGERHRLTTGDYVHRRALYPRGKRWSEEDIRLATPIEDDQVRVGTALREAYGHAGLYQRTSCDGGLREFLDAMPLAWTKEHREEIIDALLPNTQRQGKPAQRFHVAAALALAVQIARIEHETATLVR